MATVIKPKRSETPSQIPSAAALASFACFSACFDWPLISCIDDNALIIGPAIGPANIDIKLNKLSIKLGSIKIIDKGQLSNFYIEDDAAVYMREEKKIDIIVDLNIGKKNFIAYTMDLTKKYIEINSDYRS